MNDRSLSASYAICPNCGLPLRPRAVVCPSCGTLPVLERLRPKILGWADRKLRRFGPSVERNSLIVWGLALSPLLVVPPIIAIVLALRGACRRSDAIWISVVAVLNVGISLLLLVHFGHQVHSALDRLSPFWGPSPPDRQPKLTPI